MPRRFSLFEEPEAALSAVERFVRLGINLDVRRIHIDQHDCTDLDHAASAILNVVGKEIDAVRQLDISGYLPSDDRVRRQVIATGLPKLFTSIPNDFAEMELFDLVTGNQSHASATQSSSKEKVASEFVEYIERCVVRKGVTLPPHSTNPLLEIIGEVLGNVEEHSGVGRWWFSGYFEVKESLGQSVGQVVLVNFGHTISRTLLSLDPSHSMAEVVEAKIAEYMADDKSRSREDYATFLALQGGVSSLGNGGPARGQGTVMLFKYFSDLSAAGTNPQMLILSGRTRISVGREAGKPIAAKDGGPFSHIIPLNAQANLDLPPSADSVNSVGVEFPGTVVAIQFFL